MTPPFISRPCSRHHTARTERRELRDYKTVSACLANSGLCYLVSWLSRRNKLDTHKHRERERGRGRERERKTHKHTDRQTDTDTDTYARRGNSGSATGVSSTPLMSVGVLRGERGAATARQQTMPFRSTPTIRPPIKRRSIKSGGDRKRRHRRRWEKQGRGRTQRGE